MNAHDPESLTDRVRAVDLAHHMHPFTDHREMSGEGGPLVIARARGSQLWDTDGKRFIDGMAGLWCVNLGYGRDELVDAAARQMRELPYYNTFFKTTTPVIAELAADLAGIAPAGLDRVFFANSGSEANDTNIRLVRTYWKRLGRPERRAIISRRYAYHGSTIAAASLTGLDSMHDIPGVPIPDIHHAPAPFWWAEGGDMTPEEHGLAAARGLEQMILDIGPENVGAFIGEPVQGAGGVIVPPPGYWAEVQRICREYDILLIADEVICGFGRTGNLWGSQTFDIEPDILVTSKQITSSYFPLSAVLLNERAYAPIQDESGRIGTLGHGVTGAGHPVGAAVALENIAIIEERGLVANAAKQGEPLRAGLKNLADEFGLVGEMRGIGLIAALEMDPRKAREERPVGALGTSMNVALMRHGVIARNLGDTVAFCPPMIIDEEGVTEILTGVEKALKDVTAEHG